jgi:hypothetical protein
MGVSNTVIALSRIQHWLASDEDVVGAFPEGEEVFVCGGAGMLAASASAPRTGVR